MRSARAALAILLAVSIPVRAETTTDPLWYLLSTYVLSPDARAVEARSDGPADAKGLAELQADLMVLADGFESFRDEAQVKETLERLKPRMSPELRPFFTDRASSLDAIYRTLAVADYTWAQRFPEPPCEPLLARRKLLSSRDGLFQSEKGDASPWLVSLLGPQAEGKSAEQALDQASSQAKPTGGEYEKLRARVRKLTAALASEKAVGAARSKLYCARAAAFTGLASSHRANDAALISAGRAMPQNPEESVFVVVWKDRRAAAALLKTKNGPMLVTDASIVADTEHPRLFAYSGNGKPVELTATVVRRRPELGVAALTYAEDLTRPALLLSGTAPAKDDLVSAVGHTSVSGLWSKTSGLVTKIGDAGFQTDAAISPELSGGPVLNEAGEVAGLLVLRPAGTEEGRWPVAVPAPVLARWLDDPASPFSPASAPEVIEDAGTAAILTRARSSPLTETGLGAWNIPNLPPPPPVPRGVCVQNCGGGSSSASSYSGGYSNNGSAELGQALGELGAVLILKGIPALFRGIGSLFKSHPKRDHARSSPSQPTAAPKPETPPPAPKPAPPPEPEIHLSLAADEPSFEPGQVSTFTVRVTANRRDIKLGDIELKITVTDAAGAAKEETLWTDSQGVARVNVTLPRAVVAHKALDDESAKHPWLTNASSGRRNACLVTVTVLGAVAVTASLTPIASVALAGGGTATLAAGATPLPVTACAAIGAGLAALSHGTCNLMMGEEPARPAEPLPSRQGPAALPPAKAAERRPGTATKESVEADARGAHDELARMAAEMEAQAGGADDGAMGQPADPGQEPPDEEHHDEDKWPDKQSLQRHFRDHGRDFHAKSQDEYRRMAVEFFKQSRSGEFQVKVDSYGVIRVYDPKTNTFGAYNSDGTIRTLFKPRSPTYFSRQPGILR